VRVRRSAHGEKVERCGILTARTCDDLSHTLTSDAPL
jgi:hypothetical protein